ncbi:hypothetical protein BJ875DRAFT_69911 [Amylocarpus encephaloides]|uniref:Uncharacterized protein n=1 Tax=Amylocarpus encephaloides TaxID=45428 RepID=A0A9P7YFF2_9HELO|nr:hypothetical protein BJ875DRAFT_69911 [Amylocarpus encephaloides]
MPERRQPLPTTTTHRTASVRRNLFHGQLSRRPTTSSTSTSAETLRLESNDRDLDTSEIVIRDKNGEFEIGDPPMQSFDEQEEAAEGEAQEDEKERQRLKDAVKHHRDRNRAPSEPTELLEAVKASLRAKVASLADDNWMYEAEEPIVR